MNEKVAGRVTAFTGVYHADGGVRGELMYVAGKVLGRTHCGLCDITHSRVHRKREWDEMVAALGVGFELVHLNERSARVVEATSNRSPVVIAHVLLFEPGVDELLVILGEAEMEGVRGSVARFRSALLSAVAERGLRLAPSSPGELGP